MLFHKVIVCISIKKTVGYRKKWKSMRCKIQWDSLLDHRNPVFDYLWIMDKRFSYVIILFNSRRWIYLIDQILLFIILIRFSISIYPIEFTGVKFLISMGLDPELLWNKKQWDYGSKYSRIYCYCTLYSSSYCFFTYHLRKNS